MALTLFHNPDCSKSCSAVSVLNEAGSGYTVRNYLLHPPDEKELRELLVQLGMSAEELVRKNEPLFLEQFSTSPKNEEEWIHILCQHPILIERPILTDGKRAVIGRPAERIAEFLK